MSIFLYDLESTGLGNYNTIAICEVGCLELFPGKQFQSYVRPWKEVDAGATKVNGLTLDKLKFYPEWKNVGPKFMHWIQTFPSPYYLIAHNGKNYDSLVIYWEFKRINYINNLPLSQLFFCDSKILFRNLKLSKNKCYALGYLYKELFGEEIENQHTAMADVKAMCKIMTFIKNGSWNKFLEENKKFLYCEGGDAWVTRSDKTIEFIRYH